MRRASGREGSLIVWGYRRTLVAAAVAAGTAGVMWLTILFAGPLYLFPFVLPSMFLQHLLPHSAGIFFVVLYLVLPLAGIVWRVWPWGLRSVCLGMLLANLAFLTAAGQFARLFLYG